MIVAQIQKSLFFCGCSGRANGCRPQQFRHLHTTQGGAAAGRSKHNVVTIACLADLHQRKIGSEVLHPNGGSFYKAQIVGDMRHVPPQSDREFAMCLVLVSVEGDRANPITDFKA